VKDSESIPCEVCEILVKKSDWDSHIDTDIHKEKSLTQILEDRLGKNPIDETRTETTEFLEELEQDFIDKKK
jgi:hypothetical protein